MHRRVTVAAWPARASSKALTLLLAALVLSLGAVPATSTMAAAAGGPPAACDPLVRECTVVVPVPPRPPGPGGGGGSGGTAECRRGSVVVPCSSVLGSWSNALQCYVQLAQPQPPQSDPVWGGHTDGAIYVCTAGFRPGLTVPRLVWLPAAPALPSPQELARRALATLTVPEPVMRRSPSETNSDNGVPYTWVNLWTWFWADPSTWTTLTARADAGPVWAQVTVTPDRLVYTPGDGTAPVVCAGPGRPWQERDANTAPTAGGCGYRYKRVTAAPVTATLAIDWTVTWRGFGGTSGTLPTMRTTASSSFLVEQIQVVTR